ncbi:MAG: hypothetical protein ACJA07_003988 [Rhodococcus sp. (in: high G+C Gram-positive bacteria)]|jgi:hypothetical protein
MTRPSSNYPGELCERTVGMSTEIRKNSPIPEEEEGHD